MYVCNDFDVSYTVPKCHCGTNVAVDFCKGNGIFQEALVYGWVEIFNVKYDEFVFVLVWDVGEPVYDGEGVFPLVKGSFGSNGGDNVGKDLVANAAYLTFCWVD